MNKVFQPHEAHIPYLLQVSYYPIVLIVLFNFYGLKLALFEKFAGLQQNIKTLDVKHNFFYQAWVNNNQRM